MPRNRRRNHGQHLRSIPRYCAWRRALPERVVVRPLPPGVEPDSRMGGRQFGVYIHSGYGPELRLVGIVTQWSKFWSGRPVVPSAYDGSADRKRAAIWAVLVGAAEADHKIRFNGTYTELVDPWHISACAACMLQAAGYKPERAEYARKRYRKCSRNRKLNG